MSMHDWPAAAGSDHIGHPEQGMQSGRTGSPLQDLSSAQRTPPANGDRPYRILLIDDSIDLVETLSFLLELSGHVVATASDGSEGLAIARRFHPDAIICDIGLPGMSGYEVAEHIRRDPILAHAFLIALSGYAQPENIDRAMEAGFDRYCAKPLDIEALLEILKQGAGQPAH